MSRWFLYVVLTMAIAAQERGEIPVGAPAVAKGESGAESSARAYRSASAGGSSEVIDRKVQDRIHAGDPTLPVFIVLKNQPHREVLDRWESPARLWLQVVEARYAEASSRLFRSEAETSLARAEMEKAMLEVRRAAFTEIEARIRPEQDEIAQLITQLGGQNIHRYTVINMLAADVPSVVIAALAAHPSVAEISLVEKQSAQLAVSVPSLGAPVFWNAGYTGAGESVAVMDTGARTSHLAFSGLNILSRVFLDYGRMDPCFADDANSPMDYQGHGTHVAGIVASRGAPGWTAYLGVAPGLGTLYNLKIGYLNCAGGGNANDVDVLAAVDWAVQQAPWVKIFNYSLGSDTTGDDDVCARRFDYFADTYGLTISISAGNESRSGFLGLWTNPGPVTSPGIGYNVITVAAMNTQGTIDRSDDDIAIFSSRGPTVGGRKKPDIAAPGGLRDRWDLLQLAWIPDLGIYSAAYNSDAFLPMPGTSMAAPHIAGSAALLRQAGVRDPLAIKALLLNTTDWLDWGNDRGWGYANLSRAFAQRSNVLTSTLSAGRVRLYKGVANGLFYSTLTWNRSVTWNRSISQTPTGGCLSDLDLFLYNASSGATLSFSISGIDNVEKAYTTVYGPVVVNVTHWSQGSCRAPESFGLAFSEAGFQAATGPVLNASCTAPTTVAPGAQFSVLCTISNGGDLTAFSVQGALAFAGSGSSTSQDFGTIPPGGSSTKTWLVTAPASSGTFVLQLAAQSDSFGGLFSGSASLTFSTGNQVPQVASVSPASGSGATRTFTFTFLDPDGWQDLNVVNLLINFWLDGRNSCYLAYSRPLGVLYLVNDLGTALLPELYLGSGGSISNSQCTIYGAGSSASGSGNTLTLTLNMSFAPGYAGTKIIYMAARDTAGNNSGWQRMGVWTVPGGPVTSPAVVGMTPQRGSGAGPTTFAFQFSDTDGWQDLGVVNILVNDWLDGRNACYIAYSRPLGVLYLVNDAGTALLPGLYLGSGSSVSNSQCTIYGAGSFASGSGNTLTLTLNMSFQPAFAGNRAFYLAARDILEHNSGWQVMGTWTVP